MEVTIVVAMSRQRVIGCCGRLPWRLRSDLRRFRRVTWGRVVVMGRKTFESIGKVLKNRTCIVLSRDSTFTPPPEVYHATSFEHALFLAESKYHTPDISSGVSSTSELFVVGGSSVYRQALQYATKMLVTWVEWDVSGDVYFPEYDPWTWQICDACRYPADAYNQYPYTFCEYRRVICGLN